MKFCNTKIVFSSIDFICYNGLRYFAVRGLKILVFFIVLECHTYVENQVLILD